jgi:hypothetical protein
VQSHGITLSFHREMTDSSRELVGPDSTAAATFESYPRFIKRGFENYEGLGIKGSTADSKHVPSPRSRLLGNKRIWKSANERSRIFGIPALGTIIPDRHRKTEGPRDELLGQSSNQAQQFLLLWSIASRDEKGSDLNVRDLAT